MDYFHPQGGSAGLNSEKFEGSSAMDNGRYGMPDSIAQFVRRENLVRFSRMLAVAQDESERELLSDLIKQVRNEQTAAGDFPCQAFGFSEGETGML